MKNLRIMTAFFFVGLSIMFCEKQNSSGSTNDESKKILELYSKIKKQTARDLKILGIKKVLLNKDGKWFAPHGGKFFFKKDGKVLFFYHGRKLGVFYWKVENNKLFINPNNLIRKGNNFIQVVIEATDPSGYSGYEDLLQYRYSLFMMKIDDKKDILFICQLN